MWPFIYFLNKWCKNLTLPYSHVYPHCKWLYDLSARSESCKFFLFYKIFSKFNKLTSIIFCFIYSFSYISLIDIGRSVENITRSKTLSWIISSSLIFRYPISESKTLKEHTTKLFFLTNNFLFQLCFYNAEWKILTFCSYTGLCRDYLIKIPCSFFISTLFRVSCLSFTCCLLIT